MIPPESPPEDADPPCGRPPIQFGLRTLLVVMALASLIFGVLRWLEAPPMVGYLAMAVLVVSALAALGLMVVIAGQTPDDGDLD